MEDCIFCKIAQGKIPSNKIYEDDKIICFLDINPFSIGHCLVVPKKHSRWLWDMSEEDYVYLAKKTKFISNVLRKAFKTNWVEEIVAGMGIKHTHIHLFPRKDDDGLGEIPNKILNPVPSKEEMLKIADKIKNCL